MELIILLLSGSSRFLVKISIRSMNQMVFIPEEIWGEKMSIDP